MFPAVRKAYENHIRKYNKIIIVVVLITFAIIFNFLHTNNDEIVLESNTTEVSEGSSETAALSTEGYVDISGEVENPGVYKIDGRTRLYQIIDKAGGVTDNADLNQINQAEVLEDGAKIIIPAIGEENTASSETGGDNSNGLVNINNADKEELMTLNGIGEAIAGRIIEYRSVTKFESIEDIKNVSGIGEATYNKIYAFITV